MRIAHRRESKSAAAAMPAAPTNTEKPDTKGTSAKSVVPFAVKATDDAARTITGLAAAWTLDSYDDVIEPGAFARTLGRWRQAKTTRPIPLIDQHAYGSVVQVIGKMVEAEETEDGLLATFELIADDPTADAVYRRVKGGYVTGLSIGYRAIRWEYEQKEGGAEWERIRHLKEVQLLEVSVVTYPANDDARIESVKSFAALAEALKDGRLSPEQKQQLRALLDAQKAGPSPDAPEDDSPDESTSPDSETPPPEAPKGLAPDDPQRIAMDEVLRDLTLRSLAPAA